MAAPAALAARGGAIGSRSARASGVQLIGSQAAAVRDGGGAYPPYPSASLPFPGAKDRFCSHSRARAMWVKRKAA